MPQWDFLNFLAEQGRRYPGFHLLMQAEATDLIEEGGRVVGPARQDAGRRRSKSAPTLVVGCDGRHSTVRESAGLDGRGRSARRWTCCGSGCRGRPATPSETGGHVRGRPDASSCSIAATTGNAPTSSRRAASRRCSARACRRSATDVVERGAVSCATASARLTSWDEVKLLTVAVDRLQQLAPAGPALHRRRRARDVADRRRRHQSRGAGRGRRGQHPGRAAARRRASTTTCCRRCRSAASFRRASPSACRCSCRTTLLSRARWRAQRAARSRRLLLRLMQWLSDRCAAFRRGLLGLGVRPEHIRTPERR